MGNYLTAKIVDYHEKKWVQCPYCDKLLFPVNTNTVIKNFKYICKRSTCKRTMNIDYEPSKSNP